jgi:hypothetical protein
MPHNPVTLAVSSVGRVMGAADALDLNTWFRITLPGGDGTGGAAGGVRTPVLHRPEWSPYQEYLG